MSDPHVLLMFAFPICGLMLGLWAFWLTRRAHD
ncbi:hypothetical protein AFCDBAGC_4242 [Methylobacterium cerastii]|uniref:Uncharacterized protein n=1 Tax=Methylobacterium cerastii TaxID=932741 RepID=A0ABQ4QM87_9HYPH|nr:hypothetical protein AFCDBAGC_4242 [Methylobacterium cerastii]